MVEIDDNNVVIYLQLGCTRWRTAAHSAYIYVLRGIFSTSTVNVALTTGICHFPRFGRAGLVLKMRRIDLCCVSSDW